MTAPSQPIPPVGKEWVGRDCWLTRLNHVAHKTIYADRRFILAHYRIVKINHTNHLVLRPHPDEPHASHLRKVSAEFLYGTWYTINRQHDANRPVCMVIFT